MNATTLARVKAHIGDTGAAQDALLTSLIAAVSREFEAYIGYPLALAQRTEFYSIKTNDEFVFLKVLPVVSVDEVKYGVSNWDFASTSPLTADRDYRVGNDGVLFLDFQTRVGFQGVQVTYTAGLGATDENVALSAQDLALAANIQVAEEWRRASSPTTVSVPTPKGNKVYADQHRLLPYVRQILGAYQRLILL